MKIPEKGIKKNEILKTLKGYKNDDLDWKSGKVWGYVYYPGDKAYDVIKEAYMMFLSENGLDPLTFPSLLRLENEIVAMIAGLLQGNSETVGNFTTGGTESLILAVKTARDYARAVKPHIKEPEMILPITAHASFYKAAHYLDVKPVTVPVNGNSFRADVNEIRNAITDNTILLVGSAPSYAHGVIDPIEDIASLAMEKDLLMHVDSCVGGIHLSYMKKLGMDVPKFNLSVPGVTSLSVDLHKYGYAAKGASLILYKNKEIRKYQMSACSRWTGYTVINPTILSSKTGGPLAAAWAILKFLGDDGYMKIVEEVMKATKLVIDGINEIDELRVLGEPDMCMFSVTSTTDKLSIYRLADEMKIRGGWYLQPQFARDNSPANLHLSFNHSSVPMAEAVVKDLKATVKSLTEEEVDESTRNLRDEIQKLSLNFDGETFGRLAALAGVTGNDLPDRMENINQLLEVLPYDLSEFMLIEYLNNLMVIDKES